MFQELGLPNPGLGDRRRWSKYPAVGRLLAGHSLSVGAP